MIRSMTAFTAQEHYYEFGRLTWEIRTVNHRFLDIFMRLPEEFRALEGGFRERISRQISRGKVDVNLRFQPSGKFTGESIHINSELARSLLQAHQTLCTECGIQQTPNLLNLMRWPDVIEQQRGDLGPVHAAATELLEQAIDELVAGRQREGEKLSAAIAQRIDKTETVVMQLREWLPEIRSGLKDKLLERVGELKQPLEPGRLEQEVAFLAQKIDVDEELDRLAAHTKEGHHILTMKEPVGRRLDFLMQEFNREANTLSSKSIDSRTTNAAMELKVLIEQMREQVQNVE